MFGHPPTGRFAWLRLGYTSVGATCPECCFICQQRRNLFIPYFIAVFHGNHWHFDEIRHFLDIGRVLMDDVSLCLPQECFIGPWVWVLILWTPYDRAIYVCTFKSHRSCVSPLDMSEATDDWSRLDIHQRLSFPNQPMGIWWCVHRSDPTKGAGFGDVHFLKLRKIWTYLNIWAIISRLPDMNWYTLKNII